MGTIVLQRLQILSDVLLEHTQPREVCKLLLNAKNVLLECIAMEFQPQTPQQDSVLQVLTVNKEQVLQPPQTAKQEMFVQLPITVLSAPTTLSPVLKELMVSPQAQEQLTTLSV